VCPHAQQPLIYEGLLTACRLVVRGMPHAHESTLPVLVSIIVASKKMIGRFVITLMQSPTYVLLASIILAFAEFAFISTLVVRDKFMYKCCFKNRNRSQFDVLAAMKKHKLLRVRNAHMETVLEVRRAARCPVCSPVGCVKNSSHRRI
jgi:hypothetical protein